ncbi:MAG TPA: arylsulfatase, partial [Candidatus Hydrogenedentes bacterium]|nr:arylsulfatase [Candidatus Hydrogenedentota bacterium]
MIVFADDLGIGDIGPYGNTRIKTPHLDRMAAEGARLTSFFASASVCTPSRGGLLMGQYPVRNQLTADVARPSNKIGIPDNAITIADSLNELGYATACIGKWHLGHRPNQWPTEHGFDYFYGVPWSNDMTPFNLYRQSEEIESPVDQTTITERYTQEAITFIEAHQNEPFFVYLPHSMPHVPLFVSEKFAHKSDAGLYGDVIEAVDWSVGEIMKTLERLNIDDNTLVIFTSDNGPWFEGSPGRYRNRKGSAWDGGMRVPLLAWWPGKIRGGTTSDAIAMNIDLFPT